MKPFLILSIVFANFLSLTLHGQSIKIEGRIMDLESNAVPFASIAIFCEDAQRFIGSTVGDSAGFFAIQFEKCTGFALLTSAVSFNSDTSHWHGITNDTTFTVAISLRQNNLLNGVTVSAQRRLIEQKVDRMIFNVPEIYKSSGLSAWDVVKKTPGLTTNAEGVITAGSRSMTVMINNRPSQLPAEQVAELLQNLSAKDVASVEVFHSTLPQFDAQNGGIINIVLVKQQEKNWSATLRSDYIQATYPKFIQGVSFQINQKKLNITGQYMNRFREDYITEYNFTSFDEMAWKAQHARRINTMLHQFRAGLEYQFRPGQSAGFLIDSYTRDNETNALTTTNAFQISSNHLDSVTITDITGNSRQQFNSFNAHYLSAANKRMGNIAIDIDYLPATDNRNRYTKGNTYLDTPAAPITVFTDNQYGSQNTDLISVRTEINKNIRLLDTVIQANYGVKWNTSNIENHRAFSQETVNILYKESIFAAFFGGAGSFHDLQFQIGARGEYTIINNKLNATELPDNRYFNLFPSVYLGYPLSEQSQLALVYGKRLTRPDFWRLNPYRQYQSPSIYTEGNPWLKPAFVNSIDLKYIYQNNHILSFTFSQSTNNIATLSIQNNDNNTIRNTYVNLKQNLEAGVNLSSTFVINNFWQSNNYLQFLYRKDRIILNDKEQKFDIWYAYFSSNNSFFISKDRSWVYDLNCWYGSPSIEAYQYLHENWEVSMGVSKQLCQGRLNLRFDAFDIFYSNINRITLDADGQNSFTERKTDTRSFAFRITYKFGNNKMRDKRQRRTSIEEEKKRTIEQ